MPKTKSSTETETGAARRAALAARRAAAIKLLRTDLSLADVARRVGVSREAIRQWRKTLDEEGPAELLAAPTGTGRPPRLSAKAEKTLVARLRRPASASGFPSAEWTTRRVLAILELEYAHTYTVPGLWRMLERLGFGFTRAEGWRSVDADGARSKEGATTPHDQRAAAIVREMAAKGFSKREILATLRDAGVHGADGRPLGVRAVGALVDAPPALRKSRRD